MDYQNLGKFQSSGIIKIGLKIQYDSSSDALVIKPQGIKIRNNPCFKCSAEPQAAITVPIQKTYETDLSIETGKWFGLKDGPQTGKTNLYIDIDYTQPGQKPPAYLTSTIFVKSSFLVIILSAIFGSMIGTVITNSQDIRIIITNSQDIQRFILQQNSV